jgi:hypothetical protein
VAKQSSQPRKTGRKKRRILEPDPSVEIRDAGIEAETTTTPAVGTPVNVKPLDVPVDTQPKTNRTPSR